MKINENLKVMMIDATSESYPHQSTFDRGIGKYQYRKQTHSKRRQYTAHVFKSFKRIKKNVFDT